MQKLAPAFGKQHPDIYLKSGVQEENLLCPRVMTDISTYGGQFDILPVGGYEMPIWAKQNRRCDRCAGQAARSAGTGWASVLPRVWPPFTFRMVAWPGVSSAQSSMAAASADASAVRVLMRRLSLVQPLDGVGVPP